jgi:hypothetical protein
VGPYLRTREYTRIIEHSDVGTTAAAFDLFWRDHKFEHYPHMPDDSFGFRLDRIRNEAALVEYAVDYSPHSRLVANSDLLRGAFRFQRAKDNCQRFSLKTWCKIVNEGAPVTPEISKIARVLDFLVGETEGLYLEFILHLEDQGYHVRIPHDPPSGGSAIPRTPAQEEDLRLLRELAHRAGADPDTVEADARIEAYARSHPAFAVQRVGQIAAARSDRDFARLAYREALHSYAQKYLGRPGPGQSHAQGAVEQATVSRDDMDQEVEEALRPSWLPSTHDARTKWRRSYEVICDRRKEYRKLYEDGETDEPNPSIDDLRDALASMPEWRRKPSRSTVHRITKAGDNGMLS